MNRINICILFIVFALGFGSCGKGNNEVDSDAVFYNDVHNRDNDYGRTFEVKCTSINNVNLYIESSIFSEDLATQTINEIETIENKLWELDTNIYSFERNIYITDPSYETLSWVSNDDVYLSANEDVRRLAYLMVDSIYSPKQEWVCQGLTIWLTEESIQTSESIIINPQNLFAGAFSYAFGNETNVDKYLKEAHAWVSKYLEDNSITELVNQETPYDIINIKDDESDLDIPQEIWSLRIMETEDYSLSLTDGKRKFYLLDNLGINDISDLYISLVSYYKGMNAILTKIKEEAPNAYDIIEREWDKVTVIMNPESAQTQAISEKNTIYMPYSLSSSMFHETIHCLSIVNETDHEYWLSEGIAEYLSIHIEEQYKSVMSSNRKSLYSLFMSAQDSNVYNLPSSAFIKHRTIITKSINDYKDKYGPFTEDFSFEFYIPILAKLSFEAGNIISFPGQEDLLSPLNKKYDLSYGLVEEDPNAMNYFEAAMFVQYLVDTYGLEKVLLQELSGSSFEDAYGDKYVNVYRVFISWMNEQNLFSW